VKYNKDSPEVTTVSHTKNFMMQNIYLSIFTCFRVSIITESKSYNVKKNNIITNWDNFIFNSCIYNKSLDRDWLYMWLFVNISTFLIGYLHHLHIIYMSFNSFLRCSLQFLQFMENTLTVLLKKVSEDIFLFLKFVTNMINL